MSLILASASPRRRGLMELITKDFNVLTADIDEAVHDNMAPAMLAEYLAREKALAVVRQQPENVVIGCDTVVEIDGVALGKPGNGAEAGRMIHLLSGRRHQVHTGVALVLPGEEVHTFTETTHVDVAPIPDAEVESYIQTSEPYDKAGAYGIQGWAARYVRGINGCYYNVMGLPVAKLYALLREKHVL